MFIKLTKYTWIGSTWHENFVSTDFTDWFYGNAGNDEIIGDETNDAVYGGADRDELHGEGGNNSIDAGSGNDVVNGGKNTGQATAIGDRITGGTGDDIFRFYAGHSGGGQLYDLRMMAERVQAAALPALSP